VISKATSSRSPLCAAAALQLRVIGALMMREIHTRYGQSRLGYAWAIINPIMQIGILCAVFSYVGKHPPLGSSMAAFFFTGYLPYLFFQQMAIRTGNAITANRALLSFPPVHNIDAIWARLFLELATSAFLLVLLSIIFASLDVPTIPAEADVYMLGYASALSLGIAFGVLNSVLTPMSDTWTRVFPIVVRVQYFVTGVFFIPDYSPPFMQDLVSWNPLAHSIIWVREGFYDGYRSHLLHPSYPFLVAALVTLLGLTIERVLRRKIAAR